MFYLSLETQHQSDVAHMAYFPEGDVEPDFMKEIIQELAREKQWIPARFHEAIDLGNLHSGNQWGEYLKWCEGVIAAHETKRESIYKKRVLLSAKFEQHAGEVFNDSLHDGEIVQVVRADDEVTLFLDMSGGFTSKAMIQLTFKCAVETGELARDYVYDELVEIGSGYALRVLSGHPYEQWTIVFQEVEARFVFRPKAYAERERYTDVREYLQDLTPTLNYFIVENHEFVAVDVQNIEQRADGFYSDTKWLGKTTEQVIDRIYCDTYEDPYAHFSEMVPLEELEEAALSTNQALRVRAFNTMFEIDQQAAPVVNRVLRVIQLEVHEEMFMQVIAEHFDKLGLLDQDVKIRWLS